MFKGTTMVPLLLFLLLVKLQAENCIFDSKSPVCVNISSSNIEINLTDLNVTDGRFDSVNCEMRDTRYNMEAFPCLFQCTSITDAWFNGSFGCVNATMTKCRDKYVFSMENSQNCTAYHCNAATILPLIESLDQDNSHQKELMKLFYLKDSCIKLFRNNHEVMKSYIDTERQIIHNIMRASQLENRSTINHNLKRLSLNVVNISDADLNCSVTNGRIQTEFPQLLPQNESFVPQIWLPVDALCNLTKERRIIGLVSYVWHDQFQFEQEVISSMVVRIELQGEYRLDNLNTPIEMIFRNVTHENMDNDSWLQCHYFDEHEYRWATDGCETYNRTTDNQIDVICYCNHTTPFSVLLMREPVAPVHWRILSYISYTGCGLSALFTALSIVVYVFNRNHRMDYSIPIHVSLSGALFLLNSAFLLTEWGATVKPDWVCVFVASLMHYSLLCCFTWMAIEALHLYLMLIKVFNTYYKHYLVKLSLAGWGIPGVIVAVFLGVKDMKQFYGATQMTLSNTNQTNAICWITDNSFFYSLNLVYFTLTFIFSSGILLAVASSICKMKQVTKSKSKLGAPTWRDPRRRIESCRSGLTVIGLTCLLGTTWGLAFLGSGYVNYPILYLFCILNSTQGFFIFLWVCLAVKKQRKKDMEDRMSSTPEKTLETKSE